MSALLACVLALAAYAEETENSGGMMIPRASLVGPAETASAPLSAAEAARGLGFALDPSLPADVQALHRELFGGGVDGRVYLDWLRARVSRFRPGKCLSDAAAGCYEPETRALVLADPDALRGGFWERLALYVHEARHRDDRHESCTSEDVPERRPAWDRLPQRERGAGPFKCDRRPEGAYGAAALALWSIRTHCRRACPPGRGFERALERQLVYVAGESARRRLNAELSAD